MDIKVIIGLFGEVSWLTNSIVFEIEGNEIEIFKSGRVSTDEIHEFSREQFDEVIRVRKELINGN